MTGLHYDSGLLVRAAHGDRGAWQLHERTLRRGVVPVVTSPVLAAAYREIDDAGLLDRLLTGCSVVDFPAVAAPAVGRLLSRSRSDDLAAAALVLVAVSARAAVATTRPAALRRLAGALGAALPMLELATG